MDPAPRNIGSCWRGALLKDNKLISDIQSYQIPIALPPQLIIQKIDPEACYPLSALPTFEVYPVGANPTRLDEWKRFLSFLAEHRRVASVVISGWELLINPPVEVHSRQKVVVSYRQKGFAPPNFYAPIEPVASLVTSVSGVRGGNASSLQAPVNQEEKKPARGVSKYARTHPSYLETLGQTHASWMFGALAELIDNARDAKARRIDITVDQEFVKASNSSIPVLSVWDNGTGMTHLDILRMVSFGHKKPDEDNENFIGRFGVGFKTGSMRLGKDAVVFTQSKATRSIAFLSQSFNKGKDEVEIPIITYRKEGGWMEFDMEVHSREEAEASLEAVKEYSPFNEYSIGSRFAGFGEGTGTVVCVYNLERWGSNYCLEWDPKATETGLKRDIWIRSRRVRSRMSQVTREVPLDYSLHAYMEVMFLEPKMKIYIQGTRVKTSRLHKSLNKTKVIRGTIKGKEVELTLGFNQAERERGNCGMFLFWHGRLIEAYKRVGAMEHSSDVGRGVIGVIDVTDVMRLEEGVGVLNSKQGFQDCVAYALLVNWLENESIKYWDANHDPLQVGRRDENAEYTPDHSWVQCNKCLKWRILDSGVDDKDLPDEWFCFMPPFKGSCQIPESEPEAGVVTVGATRTYGGAGHGLPQSNEEVEVSTTACNSTLSNKESSDASLESDDNMKSTSVKPPILRRLKRGPPQASSRARQPATKKAWKSG